MKSAAPAEDVNLGLVVDVDANNGDFDMPLGKKAMGLSLLNELLNPHDFFGDIQCFYIFLCLHLCYLSAVPQKFPSLYLGYPKISVKDEPENEIVSLLCIVPIHEKVRQWKNVTYEIEWYTDGKRSKFTEKPFCKPQNGQNESSLPCPGDKEIHSLLNGTLRLNYYEPGQRVR